MERCPFCGHYAVVYVAVEGRNTPIPKCEWCGRFITMKTLLQAGKISRKEYEKFLEEMAREQERAVKEALQQGFLH